MTTEGYIECVLSKDRQLFIVKEDDEYHIVGGLNTPGFHGKSLREVLIKYCNYKEGNSIH